jgi:putative phosphoesterase
VKIGVLSDTHNYLDPRIGGLFAGVDHILHAGDIGLPRVLLELEQIAPVTSVCGNTDDPGFGFRPCEVVMLGGRKFLVHHVTNPHALGESLQARIHRERPHVVVFGHTHKPFCQTIAGMLFFNPGYAGKHRPGTARSVALLHCEASGIRPQYCSLEEDRAVTQIS